MSEDQLIRLQARALVDAALVLPGISDGKTLANKLRARLGRAFRDGILEEDYSSLVRRKSSTIEIPGIGQQVVTVVWGGVEINRERDPAKPHFKRSDSAWFDFHVHLRPYAGKLAEHRGALELLGYGYEIRFPEALECNLRWLRFDLNHPGHDNEGRGVRSHFHPGNEDLQAPAPVMQPQEALELLLSDLLQLPSKQRRT